LSLAGAGEIQAMQDKVIVNEKDAAFYAVEWGRTKGLVAQESPACSDKVQVRITEYLPGYAHKLHVHPVQDEIIFVLEGKGASETASGKREIGPGDVVFVPAGVHHATYNPNSELVRAIIIKSPPDSK
jgi:mannose-6-phosphate isomerase-like protein (cupin superfamily)